MISVAFSDEKSMASKVSSPFRFKLSATGSGLSVTVEDENSSCLKIFSLSGTNPATLMPFRMFVGQKAFGYTNPIREATSYIVICLPELPGVNIQSFSAVLQKVFKGPKIDLSSGCIL